MLILNMKQPLLEWAVSGVLILFLVEHMESYEQKLDTPAVQNQCRSIETCKHLFHYNCPSFLFYIQSRINHIFSSGDHVECVSVDYDPKKVSYNQLLNIFWNNHEYGLTTRVKRQYMSLILYHDEDQKMSAMESMEKERAQRAPEKIITEIAAAGPFFPAEE